MVSFPPPSTPGEPYGVDCAGIVVASFGGCGANGGGAGRERGKAPGAVVELADTELDTVVPESDIAFSYL